MLPVASYIMRTLITIVVCMEVFLPIYGQEKAGHAKSSEAKTEQRQRDSVPVNVIVDCVEAKPHDDHSAEKANGASNKPEKYFATLFSANNLPNVCLFFVGLAGVGVAIWTLLTIKRQVDTFVSKERARITVDIQPFHPSPPHPFVYDKSPEPPVRFDVRNVDLHISNSGETSAFIRAALCKACIRPMGWDAREEITNSRIGLPKVVRPLADPFKHTARIQTGQALRDSFDELDGDIAKAIVDGSQGIYVIGHIEFGDVFDNHWALKFCRKWGAWRFGGQWQGVDIWYDYPDGKSQMNGVFRIKHPSMLRRVLRGIRREKPEAPVIEIM
jgi:hypothetical protein